jgi:hypothetical protein
VKRSLFAEIAAPQRVQGGRLLPRARLGRRPDHGDPGAGPEPWLDKAVEYGDPGIGEIVTENLFAKSHADPRWLPFLRKLCKAPEQLAKIEFKVTLPQAEASAASGVANP